MLLCMLALLAASAFFSGCETALFSLTGHQRWLISREKTIIARTLASLLSDIRAVLVTLLLGNMTVNVIYFVVSTVLLIRLGHRGGVRPMALGVLSVVPLLALIFFGEVLPKLVAARRPEQWSRVTAVLTMVLHRGISPLRRVLQAMVVIPLSRLIAPRHQPPQLSARELQALLELSEKRGVIEPDEEDLLQGVVELSQLQVKDIMTPRVDIRALDMQRDPAQVIELFRQTHVSHAPAYRGDLDHVAGIIHARQALARRPSTRRDVAALVRQVTFVPELQRVDQLLIQFRKRGTTVAIAVDEYGGTAGLVSLEDVIERMVGHIVGPYEPSHSPGVTQLGPGLWRVRADLSIRNWTGVFGDVGPDADVTTIGGLVMARLGRVPAEGDRITLGNVAIEVETIHRRRVQTLRVHLVDDADDHDADDEDSP